MNQRTKPFRNKAWLDAVRSIECCVLCGKYDVEAAHRNEGKGTGMKQSDAATAALCRTCHHEIDNGHNLSRNERRSAMDRAIVLTLIELTNSGKIGVLA